MPKTIIQACQYSTKSCINFKKINNLVIQMINDHYFDLQMYANYVFDIDNNVRNLSDDNNFLTKIVEVQKEYNPKYPTMLLFTEKKMDNLLVLVLEILKILSENRISADQYLSDIHDIHFFGSGAASSTILLKMNRYLPNSNSVTPLIVKLMPFQFPHHYKYLPLEKEDKNYFIQTYMESPAYALFIKEAWMYCFSKNELAKYTPTFTCISNCYIINGFPTKNISELRNIYDIYANKRTSSGKKLPYKKWFDILVDPNSDPDMKQKIISSDYGCFEMQEIEGILDDIYHKSGTFNLSIIFEYLYTKLVAAFVGRIIFTDDHLGNVAFSTVDYIRAYRIKCNGCNYNFYMPPGKMIQFIDLERYVFNFSKYDIYTNTALQKIIQLEPVDKNKHMEKIKDSYKNNNYIFDKSLSSFLDKSFNEDNFDDKTEYKIMLQILTSPFIHDIKTFCQIMETNLPKNYLQNYDSNNIVEYYLDLDNDSLRVIDSNKVYNQSQ